MMLLSLVLALVLVRTIQTTDSHPIHHLKPQYWWMRYWHAFSAQLSLLDRYPPMYKVLVTWLFPGLIVGLLSFFLSKFLYGLPQIIFAALILWACLPDFRDLLPHDHDMNTLLVNANENLFAVVFWFILLGPAGALSYHALSWLTRWTQQDQSLARVENTFKTLHRWTGWLPSRLTGLFFALVGNFDTGFQKWRQVAFSHEVDAAKVLISCGHAALAAELARAEKEPAELAHILIERASFVWLIVLSVLSFNL
jgi:AmpE protein